MHRRPTRTTATAAAAAATVLGSLLLSPAATARPVFPDVIALPDGFQPEGISAGHGTTFYVGSRVDGSVYRGDVRTGEGSLLVPGTEGSTAVGTEVDQRNRLWVAGGETGEGRVYDARTGELLRSYQLTAPGATFVNDVVVTRTAAYFTDSVNEVLYVVRIGAGGRLGEAMTLPISGDLVYGEGFNANGIEASPDGRTLLVVQSNTGNLYAVDAATGTSRQVDLGGASLSAGDGILRQGRTLYVVRNQLNRVAVVHLDAGYLSGTVTRTLTDSDLDVPATIARVGSALYAVNARFSTPATPETDYAVVRLDRR